MRTLVIDDSRAIRLLIGNMLRELGMEVIEAGNGQEGLTRLNENPTVELIMVDWNMPIMDGLQFIQAVRSRRNFDSIRIVMVTTETESDKVTTALNAGANEYIMKPFSKEIIVAKLSMLDVIGD